MLLKTEVSDRFFFQVDETEAEAKNGLLASLLLLLFLICKHVPREIGLAYGQFAKRIMRKKLGLSCSVLAFI